MAPATRQPVLFPQLVDIEVCTSTAELVSQHDGEVFVCNPDNNRVYIVYHRDMQPDKPTSVQVMLLQGG